MYFLDLDTYNIYESYAINKVKVTNFLGNFLLQNSSFIKSKDFHPSMVKRRRNFHGIQLKGMDSIIIENLMT